MLFFCFHQYHESIILSVACSGLKWRQRRHWTELTKYWTEYSKYWTEYSKYRTEYSKYWTEYSKYWTEYSKYWTEYSKYLIPDHTSILLYFDVILFRRSLLHDAFSLSDSPFPYGSCKQNNIAAVYKFPFYFICYLLSCIFGNIILINLISAFRSYVKLFGSVIL